MARDRSPAQGRLVSPNHATGGEVESVATTGGRPKLFSEFIAMLPSLPRTLLLFLLLLLARPEAGRALAPYTPDAHTLFLFHFDENAGGSVAANLGTRGNHGYSVNQSTATTTPPPVTTVLGAAAATGFGNAAQFSGGTLLGWDANGSGVYQGDNGATLSADAVAMSTLNMGNGSQTPWTIEAMVRCSLTSLTAQQQIVCTDSSAGARGFQFRINSSGQLELNLIGAAINPKTALPTSGPHAYAANTWFHAAATYDGTSIRLYWTRVDSGATSANLLSTTAAVVGTSFGTVSGPLCIGGENRAANGEYFQGRIDEVRLSSVARTAAQFIFKDPNDLDADGLPDAWEQQIIDASSTDAITTIEHVLPGDDFDGDGATNAAEHAAGSNPTNPQSVPSDTDADGLPDAWETLNFGSLAYDAGADPDLDGFHNGAEQAAGTDPNDPLAYPGAPADPTKPTGLMVDLLAFPRRTTIPDTQPEFTWIFNPRERGESQTAYEIIVASSAALAGSGTGDVWSSGKVSSSHSVNVAYAGAALARGSTYHWRVRTWGGRATPTNWSAIQGFTVETTLPQTGARSLYKASASDATGYNWAGRYRSAFDTTVAPANVVNKGGGNYFIDFGQAAFGYLTLRLNGSYNGQTLTVRFGEAASGNSVNTSPGYTIRYSATSQPLANGDVTYEIRPPATTFPSYADPIDVTGWAGNVTPFRYVELLNCPGPVTAADLRQHVLHTPFDDTAATFTSSNSILNTIWALCHHSIKVTTFAAAYVDGDRERTAYEGDAYINQFSHYAVDREFSVARYSYELLLDNHTWPTEWRFHFPLMAWADYLYTGNAEALAANYAAIRNYLRLDRERASDRLFQGWPNNGTNDPSDLIDWPVGERDGNAQASYSSVINAFHYRNLRLMAQIAEVLGNAADAADFSMRANTIQASFNSVFWNASANGGNGLYTDGEGTTNLSAHGNFFPMAFGLVPQPRVSSVMQYLKTTRTINGRVERMPCSVYGAQYLLEALFDGGEEDHAISLMADSAPTRKRHWYNMIAEGSTVTMEAWGNEFKNNQDWNHAWGAAPANIISRYVLGVKPLTAGFAQAEVKPQLGTGSGANGLTSAAGTVPTIRGPVQVQAENGPGIFKLRLKTPGNMTAKVLIPTKGLASPALIHNGRLVSAPLVGDRLVLENVPAGQHAIWLSATATPPAATLQENWKLAMFGDNASNPEIAGDTADPDGDGFANSAEFSAATDPMSFHSVPDDGDQLPTDWEIAHFGNTWSQDAGSDPDHDGTDNLTELRLGLDPMDSRSRFRANYDGATVTWLGVGGVFFTIKRSTNLSGWQSLTTQPGVNGTNTYTDPEPPSGKAFYRVILEP